MKKPINKNSSANPVEAINLDVQLPVFEKRLEGLKLQFDQYFSGIARRAPLKDLDSFRIDFGRLAPHEIRSTAHRFKHQTIKTRFIQLNALWQKNLRAIEEGTFHRDLFLLKAKTKNEAPVAATPAPVAAPSKSDQGLHQLYEKYSQLAVAAQQKIPSKESFVKALRTQIDAQKAKNPNAKFELKLQKDEGGKYQVKLKVNKAP